MLYRLLLIFTLVINPFTTAAFCSDRYTVKRNKLVDLIEDEVKETSRYIGKKQLDKRVMRAMRTVPRHKFVEKDQRRFAYENRPLSIGYGQTISQPYIVALMTDLLQLSPSSKVLEIGTGSGYQAAILAELIDTVYTIEIITPLAKQAEKKFKRLQLNNIQTRIGDGYYGWKQHGPYDGIIVTAAASHVPPPLLKQLKKGGKMVIPVGGSFMVQQLLLVTKDRAGRITTRQILPVRFVPLTGER